MSQSLLAELMCALDLAGLERLSGGSFVALTPPPHWLTHVFGAAAAGEHVTIAKAFPFLDTFLSEAEAFWRGGPARSITSGPFAVEGPSGQLLLRAAALNVGSRSLLVLERLRGDADPRSFLQTARENKLNYERIVKQIGAVEPALSRLVSELLQTDLTSAQREVAEGINRVSARLRAVTEGLHSPHTSNVRPHGPA